MHTTRKFAIIFDKLIKIQLFQVSFNHELQHSINNLAFRQSSQFQIQLKQTIVNHSLVTIFRK